MPKTPIQERLRSPIALAVAFGLLLVALLIGAMAMAQPAAAQTPMGESPMGTRGTRVGGHAGVVVPVVTFSDAATTTVDENFVVGFPVGVGVGRAGGRWTFDLELVPLVDPNPQSVELLVHPGLIYAAAPRLALGVRAAFEVDGDVYGFTPLAAYSLATTSGLTVFAELDLPVRFATDGDGGTVSSVAVVPHIGISF